MVVIAAQCSCPPGAPQGTWGVTFVPVTHAGRMLISTLAAPGAIAMPPPIFASPILIAPGIIILTNTDSIYGD